MHFNKIYHISEKYKVRLEAECNNLNIIKTLLLRQFEEMVELIKGKIVYTSPAPSDKHQVISGNFYSYIHTFLKRKPCKVFSAPYNVRLTQTVDDRQVTTVVQPDLCIICYPNKRDKRGCLGAPDMIIEILSPNTAEKDVRTKFDLYEESGVLEYWIVDPLEELADVFVLKECKYIW